MWCCNSGKSPPVVDGTTSETHLTGASRAHVLQGESLTPMARAKANGTDRTPISIVRTAPRRYTTGIGASSTTMAIAAIPIHIKGGLIGGAALNSEWETEVLLRSTISRL